VPGSRAQASGKGAAKAGTVRQQENMMKNEATKGRLRVFTTELFPVAISLFSLFLSTFNFYVGYLKRPDIDFVVAPYISQVVDSRSGNEAFYIPLTVVNRGARPGTVLSFELTVTRSPDSQQAEYFAQYYGQADNPFGLGVFFTPLSLNGYSSVSQTVCFYPTGTRQGAFFSPAGNYDFQVIASVANVQAGDPKRTVQDFHVALTDEMLGVMKATPGGMYPYPIPVKLQAP
jgi:hypothetical protein